MSFAQTTAKADREIKQFPPGAFLADDEDNGQDSE
jgi:hypothetical protein